MAMASLVASGRHVRLSTLRLLLCEWFGTSVGRLCWVYCYRLGLWCVSPVVIMHSSHRSHVWRYCRDFSVLRQPRADVGLPYLSLHVGVLAFPYTLHHHSRVYVDVGSVRVPPVRQHLRLSTVGIHDRAVPRFQLHALCPRIRFLRSVGRTGRKYFWGRHINLNLIRTYTNLFPFNLISSMSLTFLGLINRIMCVSLLHHVFNVTQET